LDDNLSRVDDRVDGGEERAMLRRRVRLHAPRNGPQLVKQIHGPQEYHGLSRRRRVALTYRTRAMTMPDTPPQDGAHLDGAHLDPTDPAFERMVIGIIAKKKKLDPAGITQETTFEQLGIDSLDGIDLVFTFEDAFNISIPDQVVQKMKSVGQVLEALRDVLSKRAPGPA
jgi:acyl carrier protein